MSGPWDDYKSEEAPPWMDYVDTKGKSPGVRAALKDLQKYQPEYGMTDRLVDSYTFNASRPIGAAVDAGVTALRNLHPRTRAPYTAEEMKIASRLYAKAQADTYGAKHPVKAITADVVGGLAMPGAKQVGKWVLGNVAPRLAAAGERALQTARLSAAAGTGAAVRGGLGAAPGQEIEDAKTQGAWGAALAPPMGLAAGLVGQYVAPALAETTKRVVGPVVERLRLGDKVEKVFTPAARRAMQPKTPTINTVEKLATVLRKEGVTPVDINAAIAEWRANGVSPTLIDIIKTSGASPSVLRLIQNSGVQARARVDAEKYAKRTTEEVGPNAIREAKLLKTGEPRTPSQIKADRQAKLDALEARQASRQREIARRGKTKVATIDARTGKRLTEAKAKLAADVEKVDADLTVTTAKIDEDIAAGTRPIPASPVAPEDGAARFADELNARYDASKKTYTEAYQAAERALPESALIDDIEVRPLLGKLQTSLGRMNPDSTGVKAVKNYLETVKGRVAPGDASDWPEGEVMENARPLTFLDLWHAREMMNEFASKFDGAPGQVAALKVKGTLDSEMRRLVEENKITGDPAVVDQWKTAVQGFRQHMEEFGSGLAEKLTARVPGKPDVRVVEPWRAGNVIFGDKENGVRPLNTVLHEVEPTLKISSPEAIEALKGELYGRVKPEDLAKLRTSTGGKTLFPEGITEESIAAQQANRLAVEAAEDAKKAAVETAKGAKLTAAEQAAIDKAALEAKGLERRTFAENNAAEREAKALAAAEAERAAVEAAEGAPLALGEKVLTEESEKFLPAVAALDNTAMPVAGAASKQSIVNFLESKDPAVNSRFGALMSPQATQNLSATLGKDQIAALQAKYGAFHERAQNAHELGLAAGSAEPHTNPMLEFVTPGYLASPRYGLAGAGISLAKMFNRMKPGEAEIALRMLSEEGAPGVDDLMARLIKKYPGAKRAAAPALSRPLLTSDDEGALERLQEEYGL